MKTNEKTEKITIVRRNPVGRPAGEERRSRVFGILKTIDEKLVERASKTGETFSKIINDALDKYLIMAMLILVLFASCKKEEPECYACRWVKNGDIQPGSEERCGPDVQTWALTVRQNQPNFYPVCFRKQ